jgi:hypothetical protein
MLSFERSHLEKKLKVLSHSDLVSLGCGRIWTGHDESLEESKEQLQKICITIYLILILGIYI